MRTLCLAMVVLVACKEKQDAKPTAPAATQEPAPTAPTPEAAPATPPAIKPAGGFTTTADYQAKAFELVDQLTDVFVRAGTNCEKVADGIELFLADHKADFAGIDAFEAANPSAEDELDTKMEDRAKTFMTKASASMQACQKHERVQAALARLPD